jgi:hypothetical protein
VKLIDSSFTTTTYKTQHFSKYKEHKQEDAVIYLQAKKTHTTSTLDQEKHQRSTSEEETHLYKNVVHPENNIRKSVIDFCDLTF